jgi:uridine kinase
MWQKKQPAGGAMNTIRPVIIGVAGGTGSGKTTVSQAIRDAVGEERIAYIMHDSYYREVKHLPPEARAQLNFDHPNSLDSTLLVEHLRLLLDSIAIEVPIYDFTTDSRTGETITVYPHPVILVEGILIFAEPELRPLFDVKIFVDTEDDIRFIRRLLRDISERGRDLQSVVDQWLATVKPMHDEFVEPSKRWADIIIPHGGKNRVAMDMVVSRIESLLRSVM